MDRDGVDPTCLRVLIVGPSAVADELRGAVERAGHAAWTTPVRGVSDGRVVALATPDVAIVHLSGDHPDRALAVASLLTEEHRVAVVAHGDAFSPHLVQRLGGLCPRGVLVSPVSDDQLQATLAVAACIGVKAAPSEDVGPAELRGVLERIRDLLASVGVTHGGVRPVDGPDLTVLTRREREVLEAFVRLRRIPDVAESLFISRHTVRNHLKAIYAKLGVHSQPELMVLMLSGRT
jgi:DNA-binding NarL/FixJ family response regulator